ncbi:MAG: hypothetical protein ACC608_03115 [Anaerofustis sp.]
MKVWKNSSIIPILKAIMLTNTEHYQTDYEIDQKILRNAAKSRYPEEKKLLWMSRPSGTHCIREREVFIKGTYEHNTWKIYHEQTSDSILAYFVELRYWDKSGVYGNVYELNYAEHVKAVQDFSVDPKSEMMIFEDGFEAELPFEYDRKALNDLSTVHGKVVYRRTVAVFNEDLCRVIAEQEKTRDRGIMTLQKGGGNRMDR